MSFIRTGQVYEFNRLRLKVIIHDSYYELRELDSKERFTLASMYREDWLHYLVLRNERAEQPMSLEDFKKTYLTLNLTEWIRENKADMPWRK